MTKFTKAEQAYLDWIRTHSCCWCGARAPSVAHHHNVDPNPSGMGRKCSNWSVVPLCDRCHQRWHDQRKLPVSSVIIAEIIESRDTDTATASRYLERKVAQFLIKWMDRFDPEVF